MMNHAAFILCTSLQSSRDVFGCLLWRKLDVVEAHRISAAVGVTPNHRELEGIVAGRRECHVAKIKLLENTIGVSAVFVFRRSNVSTIDGKLKDSSRIDLLRSDFPRQ